jgi:hypothetical protein
MREEQIAIMQPYFFPYLGYFQLINVVDRFILFDTPQFIRHGWIERNQILKPNGETLYIKVPLKKHARTITIKEIEINNSQNWKEKIFAQLVPYKRKAPYYRVTLALLQEALSIETNNIVELNKKILITICQYLGINTRIDIWSDMNVNIAPVNAPDEWALNICKSLKIQNYINPIGGKHFFDVDKFANENVKISFLSFNPRPYVQMTNQFVPFLSILDVLMFNSREDVCLMLNEFKLE